MKRIAPWIVLAAAAAWLAVALLPPSAPADGLRVDRFGAIPVVDRSGDRVMPMDTMARNVLLILSGGETFVDGEGKRRPAVQWAIDVIASPQDPKRRAFDHRVFRIDHPQLLDALGLKPRERYRYAVGEFADAIDPLIEQAEGARKRRAAKQEVDAYERAMLKLFDGLQYFRALARLEIPKVVPPLNGQDDWKTVREASGQVGPGGAARAWLQGWDDMIGAYAKGDAAKFNEAVENHLARFQAHRPSEATRARLESYFYHVDPFSLAKYLYLFAFVFTCLAWWGSPGVFNRSATLLILFTFALHTVALGLRVYLSGQAPVTNLYSSAVFIGWACVLLGLVLERLFPMAAGNVIASVAGVSTLLIANALAADGDTLASLEAVLDTRFWLWTHVICITLGYATTYVAGLLGLLFIVRGVLTPSLTEDLRRSLARMIYGITCFAIFFSFVGTVLGGLWADDSWGRFWGWDPKENGALMIVLWNAVLLHARWGGLVRERGLAVLSVFGNIVVTWSWFGVNQLSVGLHNYGFKTGVTFWLVSFVVSQLVVISMGLLPSSAWKSKGAVREADAEGR
jgi:ABC-type transport system involved in cytochrome c biogenesis permease subunit